MIAGLDASTASTGLAMADGTLITVSPSAGADDPGRRLDQIDHAVIRAIRLAPPLPRLVLIEGPADHSPGIRSTIAIAKVRAVLEVSLFRLGVETMEIPPSRLKRYATGNGRADKEAMIAAALADGAEPRNDDEADAYWLRHLGRAAHGLEPLTLPHRIEIASAITWPTLGAS
jgi:crossover junction endodeoxyribonuclease RuvC